MEKCCAKVNYIEDRLISNRVLKFLIRLFPLISPKLFTDYYLSHVRKFYVNVDNTMIISGQSLNKINDLHTDATKILYPWDCPKNRLNTLHISECFDNKNIR